MFFVVNLFIFLLGNHAQLVALRQHLFDISIDLDSQ